MSIFKDLIERKANEAIAYSPAVQTGYMIPTASVISENLKNPYFLSLNHMSALDGIKLDSIKTGYSVVVKDLNGVSRNERVFSNPKPSDLTFSGDTTGHKPLDDSSFTLVDVIFSGNNNQLPTVIGFQQRKSVNPNADKTFTTDKDSQDNKAQEPAKEDKPGFIERILGAIFPDHTDSSGKKVSSLDRTRVGPYGNVLRTGTLKITEAELTAYTSDYSGVV